MRVETDECCGRHAVCERDAVMQQPEIIYYDDEQLDVLIGRDPSTYSADEIDELRYVFDTMMDKDVQGWLRSLSMRDIALPQDLRDEALLIIADYD